MLFQILMVKCIQVLSFFVLSLCVYQNWTSWTTVLKWIFPTGDKLCTINPALVLLTYRTVSANIIYHCYFLVPYSIKIWIINIKQHNFQPWQTLLATSQVWCRATTVSPDCSKQQFEAVVGARREPLLYGMRMSGEGEGCQTRCHCLPHRHAHILILTICKIENKNSSVALLLGLCIKSKSCYNTEIMRTLDYIHIQVFCFLKHLWKITTLPLLTTQAGQQSVSCPSRGLMSLVRLHSYDITR